MFVKQITRTALIAASAVALGAGLGLVAPANAQPLETQVSDTWKPGFTFDDGQYVRLVPAQTEGLTTGLRVEHSDVWTPDFTLHDDDGSYVRLVKTERKPTMPSQTAEVSDTWRPGTFKDDDKYVRFVTVD